MKKNKDVLKVKVISNRIYFEYFRGTRKKFSTGVVATEKDTKDNVKILTSIRNRVQGIINSYIIEHGVKPPAQFVWDEYNLNKTSNGFFLDHFDEFIKNLEDSGRKPQSIEIYKQIKKHIEVYEDKHGKLNLKDGNEKFFRAFKNFMKDLGLQDTTINRRLKALKSYLFYLHNYSLLEFDRKINDMKLDTSGSDNFYTLSLEEVKKLYEHKFEDPTLTYIRDIFIFQCMTSFRISDVLTLKPYHIKDDIIEKSSVKIPSAKYVVALNSISKEIWERNGENLGHFSMALIILRIKEMLQKSELFNEVIEIDGVRQEKWKFITSHTGRKTFITIMIQKGATLDQLMSMTSHKTISVLTRYIDKFANKNNRLTKLLEV